MHKKLSLLAAFLPSILWAQEPSADSLGHLLSDAAVQIEKERLNVDYTPSVVSVVDHKRLSVLGIKTLFEALSILPGVETSISQFGIKKVIVRGFDNPDNFTFDKTRLLIDGVPIETAFLSNTSTFLELPVDVIDRVELLRGPASAFYGSGAFNGVINVITRHRERDGNALFASGGSYGYTLAGGRFYYALDDGTSLAMDAYLQRASKQLPLPSEFSMNNVIDPVTFEPIPFPRPLETNEQLHDYSIGAILKHGGWHLKTRFKDRQSGNFYGWDEKLEMRTDLRTEEKYFYVEGGFATAVAPDTALDTVLEYSRYSMDVDAQNYEGVGEYQIPYVFGLNASENRFRLESKMSNRSLEEHAIEAGIVLQTIREIGNEIKENLSPYGNRPMVTPGLRRDHIALFARDTWDVSDQVGILAAVRGDYYTEEEQLYPSAQFGVLYTPVHALRMKFNYGHAFRVPSWVEQYSVAYGPGDGTRNGYPDLIAETTDTLEWIGIWQRGSRSRLQLNTYFSWMNDVIDACDSKMIDEDYVNWPERTSTGAELSYDQTLFVQDKLHLNLSYTHTTYETAGSQIEQLMPTAAIWMAKGYYVHYLTPSLSLSGLGKYVGKRPRNEEFDQDHSVNVDLDPYFTFDIAIAYQSTYHWDLRFAVKNLFDEDVRYPSYYSRHPYGIPREGRNFLAEAEYRF